MSSPVPEGWTVYALGELGQVVGGGTPPSETLSYWGGSVMWATPTEITKLKGRYINKTLRTITEEGLQSSSAKLHPKGTILLTSRASIGYPAINRVPMATNQGFQSLRPNEKLDVEYGYQLLLNSKNGLERLSAGSTFLEISSKEINKYRLPIPPLPEQKKIASILTSVDEVIEKTESQISKLQDLKTGMMQELLTKGIGHTEFKDSPVGSIPVGWDVYSLEQVSNKIWIGLVTTMTKNYVDNGTLLIRNSDIKEFSFRDEGLIQLDNTFASKYASRSFRVNDIATVHTGDVGTSAVIDKRLEGAHGFATLNTRINPDLVSPNYLCNILNSALMRTQYKKVVTGDGRDNLNLGDFVHLQVAIPTSLEEQKEIEEVIDSIRFRIKGKSRKLVALKTIKRALMQDLLTGKVRVKTD